jgi:hypothetical protein
LDPETDKYIELFKLEADQLQSVEKTQKETAKLQHKQMKKKNKMDDVNNLVDDPEDEEKSEDSEISEEPDSDPEENKLLYIDLVKKALIDSKRILEHIEDNGALNTQLYAIFKTFSGAIKTTHDDDDLEIEQR